MPRLKLPPISDPVLQRHARFLKALMASVGWVVIDVALVVALWFRGFDSDPAPDSTLGRLAPYGLGPSALIPSVLDHLGWNDEIDGRVLLIAILLLAVLFWTSILYVLLTLVSSIGRKHVSRTE